MAVEMKTDGPTLVVGTPVPLFDLHVSEDYDVVGNGEKFLIGRSMEEHNAAPLTLVVNWTAELE